MIWKPVRQWECLYEVSDTGAVRSLPRPGKYRMYGGHLLTPRPKNGYLCVTLSRNATSVVKYVHHLVLEAFVRARPSPHACTNHLNGIRTDNRVSNLEWTTLSGNNAHSREVLGNTFVPESKYTSHPELQYGEANSMSKLSDKDVREIRRKYGDNPRRGIGREIASEYGVSQAAISMIVNRKRWQHI